MQFDFVMLGESVDQVGGGHGFSDAVLPTATFNQVVEKQCDDVVRLEEGTVLIDDAKTIGVSVGSDADMSLGCSRIFSLRSSRRWSSGSGAWPPKRTSRQS